MFVVLDGSVRVTIEPSGQEVAVTPAGGFFGEMSLLTGAPRTATVRAVDDARVLEIGAAAFTQLAAADPRLLDHVTTVISSRQAGLDQARAAAVAAVLPLEPQSLLARIRKYLKV
jgi:CRP-like cAMP-binding protein